MSRIWKLGDNINTDIIIPGRYNVTTDRTQLAKYCLCEVFPTFAQEVQPGDIIVAGHNTAHLFLHVFCSVLGFIGVNPSRKGENAFRPSDIGIVDHHAIEIDSAQPSRFRSPESPKQRLSTSNLACSRRERLIDGRYLLGMNRDERIARGAGSPPEVRECGGTKAVYPSDGNCGTWIGANDHGMALTLLNWNDVVPGAVGTPVGRSRGSVIPAIIGFALPALYLRNRRGRRLGQFEEGLPRAMELMANSMKAGQSIELLATTKNPTREQIVAHMDGNICRCGTYPRIVRAIQRAAREG